MTVYIILDVGYVALTCILCYSKNSFIATFAINLWKVIGVDFCLRAGFVCWYLHVYAQCVHVGLVFRQRAMQGPCLGGLPILPVILSIKKITG